MKYFEFKLASGDTAFMREDLVRRVTIHDGPDKYGVTGIVFYDGARQEFPITNTLPEIRKILGLSQETEVKEKFIVRKLVPMSGYLYVSRCRDRFGASWTQIRENAEKFDFDTAKKIADENDAEALPAK